MRRDFEDDEICSLQPFEFNIVKVPFPTVLLVGKRNSGKSVTSQSIAVAHSHIPRWCVWAGTKDTAAFWSARLGSAASIYGADEKGIEALQRIMEYQEHKVELYKSLKRQLPTKYHIGFIFDDVTSKRKFCKGNLLEELFSNGRHLNAVIIICCQYIKQLPPATRTNTDYLFMLFNTKKTLRLLHEEYVEVPDDFEMFSQLQRAVTSQKHPKTRELMYNSLVFDNTRGSDRLDEIFRVFTPPQGQVLPILLGSEEWRSFNSANFANRTKENELRRFRKREHMHQMRQRQHENIRRRQEYEQMFGTVLPAEVDVFSDDDDSDTDENEPQVVTLQRRRGASIQVLLPHMTSAQSALPILPPPPPEAQLVPLDLRPQLPETRFSFNLPRSNPRYSRQLSGNGTHSNQPLQNGYPYLQ